MTQSELTRRLLNLTKDRSRRVAGLQAEIDRINAEYDTEARRLHKLIGEWTVVFEGGPAFWQNVLAVLDWAGNHSGIHASTREIAKRMHDAEATYEETAE